MTILFSWICFLSDAESSLISQSSGRSWSAEKSMLCREWILLYTTSPTLPKASTSVVQTSVIKAYFQSRTGIYKNNFSTVYDWHETCLPKALLWRSSAFEGNVALGETPAGNSLTLKISWRWCWKNDFIFCSAGWSFRRSVESVWTYVAATAGGVVGFAAIGIFIPSATCRVRSWTCWWIKYETGVGGNATVILGAGSAVSTSVMGRMIGRVPIGTDGNARTICWGVSRRWIDSTDDKLQ